MKCAVTINNGIDENITSEGQLSFSEDGFGLFYEIYKDRCILRFSNGELTQARRGNVELKLIFSEGKETLCTLGSGDLSGTFPVFTEKLSVQKDENGVSVFLSYVCADENKILDIKAEIIR